MPRISFSLRALGVILFGEFLQSKNKLLGWPGVGPRQLFDMKEKSGEMGGLFGP